MPLTDHRLAEIEQKFLSGEYTVEQMENAIELHKRFQMLELFFSTTDKIEGPEEREEA